MKFGLKEKQFRFLLEALKEHLLKDYPNSKIWIFGSRARGDHRSASDIDLLIESIDKVPNRVLALLRSTLEESSFPFKVDLVSLDDLAEEYREQVLKERRLFTPSDRS